MVALNHLNHSQRKSKIFDKRNGREYTIEEAHSKLPNQKLYEVGDLICLYTKVILPRSIVESYNQYTEEFNRSNWQPDQQWLLDLRHKFIHGVMLTNQQDQDAGRPITFEHNKGA
ncbi:hypothetical protein [Photobacterium leiognathi]|uniref:hypothetical protein n=1 Tax=Photobacterium leiognathi TaxID=553611 RepID=UPI0029820893|nr:hypothetical protein [Photobacterium leiognathi]